MPAYYDDAVLDGGLEVLEGATELHVCSGSAPADRSAVVAQSLASTSLDVGDFTLGDASPDGRGVTVASQQGVSVSSSGTPTYYCLVDGSTLLAYTEVDSSSPELTADSTVNIPSAEFSIGDPDVVA